MSAEIILALIKPLLVLGLLLTNTIILIWLERKVVAGGPAQANNTFSAGSSLTLSCSAPKVISRRNGI